LGALCIQTQEFQDGLWVVDGQQRLTSLANGLSEAGAEDERFALAYDLNQQQFMRLRQQENGGYTVPLSVLFDLERLIRWFTKDYPEASEKLDAAARITCAIREYQVPAYAAKFLQENAGIPHFAFLPYRYLLVVLTRFFAHFPEPHPRNRILFVHWFWRAALIGPGPIRLQLDQRHADACNPHRRRRGIRIHPTIAGRMHRH